MPDWVDEVSLVPSGADGAVLRRGQHFLGCKVMPGEIAARLFSMTATDGMYVPVVDAVSVAGRWSIAVRFTDGTEGIVDLSHLKGREGFEKWRSRRYFRGVRVQGGTVMWGDWEVSVCADMLYCEITGVLLKDLYPPEEAVEAPSLVADKPEGELYVEYPDGTKGLFRPTEDMKTGREFPAEDFGKVSDGVSKVAPWGDIIWRDVIELSSEKVKSFLIGRRFKLGGIETRKKFLFAGGK